MTTTPIGITTLTSSSASSDTTKSILRRDPYMMGGSNSGGVLPADNNGVRFLFDLGLPWCFPGGSLTGRPDPAAPNAGQAIYDMAEMANGSFALPGVGPSWNGNGFDFTPVTTTGCGVQAPASALADIFAAAPAGSSEAGSAQHYLVWGWFKMPSAANWNATAGMNTIMSASDSGTGYNGSPDLVCIGMMGQAQSGGGIKINARRQTALGTIAAEISVALGANDPGTIVQIGFWRNAAGVGLTLRSAAGRVTTTQVIGSDNAADPSTKKFTWGKPAPFSGGSAGAGFTGLRVYRGGIENLARSGRNPLTALDFEWYLVQSFTQGLYA